MGSIVPIPTDQKVAFITGGSSGIGAELARRLHRKGYRVAISGRRAKEGEAAARAIDVSGEQVVFVQCDVASYAEQAAAFRSVWDRWGRLDAVVCNAGFVDRDSKFNLRRRDAAVHDLPPEPDTSCTDADFKGVIYGTVLAVHFMRHNAPAPGGKIVVTGSMIGVQIGVTFPEYSAAKAGVHHWVRTMAPLLLRKDNVAINVVMPGAYDTNAMPDFKDAFLPEHLATHKAMMSAYDLFLDDEDNQRTGMAVEVAHDKYLVWDPPEYKSGDVARRNEKPYEPWFSYIHGEPSGLPGAVLGPVNGAEADKAKQQAGDKIIAVTGATGSQGGGVVNVMKKTPGWKVRAITRNPGSDKAKKLAAEGIEVVQASFDDEASLAKAFEGVHAVFSVTNWWEHLFCGKTQDEAGELEEEQGMKIARAAARTPTLEHFLWSTTPSPKRMFNGALLGPHMDYKANVDARIKAELPELAKRTTYLYLGYYPQNLAFFPTIKPVWHPDLNKYIQTLPTKPDAKVLLAGDLTVNPGIWVRQALATGERAFGRYANVALEKWTFQQMLDEWSRVTGKGAVFVQCTAQAYEDMWGLAGRELALQFRYGEACDPWAETPEHISPEELGIRADEVVGFTGTIEGLKWAWQ